MVRRKYIKPELDVEQLLNHNILLSSDTADENFGDPWGDLDLDDPYD